MPHRWVLRRLAALVTAALIAAVSAAGAPLRDSARAGNATPSELKTAPGQAAETAASKPDAKDELLQHPFATRIGDIPADLTTKHLMIPVPGITAKELKPMFFDARGRRGHEAIDIMAPRGRPVVAVEDGRIAKLFTSVPGGLTVYQFDPTENYAYYYAHLERYADGLAEGDKVKRGQTIGYVGSTGNASATQPHLHFAIFKLGPERQWWKGDALDPYPALTQ